MFPITTWALRAFGLSGVLGSLLFIYGDLLYNHVPGSAFSPAEKMAGLPESRLLKAGTLGLAGCWFYALGALHVYLAFRPAGEAFAYFLWLSFGAVMICYGISHAAYFSIAAGAKAALSLGGTVGQGSWLGEAFFKRLTLITYIPAAVSSLMMLYGILSGRSLYPWGMVFSMPLLLYVLKALVLRLLRGRPRELVNDAYDNLVLFVFFLASTLVLWNAVVV
jgi:hypothetical protein